MRWGRPTSQEVQLRAAKNRAARLQAKGNAVDFKSYRATIMSLAGGAVLALPVLVLTGPLLRLFGPDFDLKPARTSSSFALTSRPGTYSASRSMVLRLPPDDQRDCRRVGGSHLRHVMAVGQMFSNRRERGVA